MAETAWQDKKTRNKKRKGEAEQEDKEKENAKENKPVEEKIPTAAAAREATKQAHQKNREAIVEASRAQARKSVSHFVREFQDCFDRTVKTGQFCIRLQGEKCEHPHPDYFRLYYQFTEEYLKEKFEPLGYVCAVSPDERLISVPTLSVRWSE
jgi:hypothetical protein